MGRAGNRRHSAPGQFGFHHFELNSGNLQYADSYGYGYLTSFSYIISYVRWLYDEQAIRRVVCRARTLNSPEPQRCIGATIVGVGRRARIRRVGHGFR